MRSRTEYHVLRQVYRNTLRKSPRMRNPCKATCKRLMRAAYRAAVFGALRFSNTEKDYFLFNWVGARLYTVSKGRICNRAPFGYKRYFHA